MEVVMVVDVGMAVAMVMATDIPAMATAMVAIRDGVVLAMAAIRAPMGLRMVMPPRRQLLHNQQHRVPASKPVAIQTSPHRDVSARFLFNGSI